MCYNKSVYEEAKNILEVLNNKFCKKIDGKSAIIEMKQKQMPNWKQMEWPGWYFEDIGRNELINKIGGSIGPTFNRITFDYERNFVWDLKTHSIYNHSGRKQDWVIFNDLEAIKYAIDNWGGLGFIVASAEMTFEKNGEFREWHNQIKGGLSQYQIKKRKQGAWKRKRKKECLIRNIDIIFLNSKDSLSEGRKNGWLKGFQEGMVNSNDNLRRAKVQVNIEKIPDDHIIISG